MNQGNKTLVWCIFLNIVVTYGRSLYAPLIGLFCGRWTLMALGQGDFGLMGVVGGGNGKILGTEKKMRNAIYG